MREEANTATEFVNEIIDTCNSKNLKFNDVMGTVFITGMMKIIFEDGEEAGLKHIEALSRMIKTYPSNGVKPGKA